jgi:hypothetical protein
MLRYKKTEYRKDKCRGGRTMDRRTGGESEKKEFK